MLETPTVPRGHPENLFDIGPVRAERGEVRDAAGRCLAVGTTWARFVAGIPDEVFRPPRHPAAVDRGACLGDLLRVRLPDSGQLDLPPRADLGNPQGMNAAGALCASATVTARSAVGPGAVVQG